MVYLITINVLLAKRDHLDLINKAECCPFVSILSYSKMRKIKNRPITRTPANQYKNVNENVHK